MCAEWEVSCDVMGHWSVTSQESAPGNSLITLQDVQGNCASFILHHLWFLLIDFSEISPLQSEWKKRPESRKHCMLAVVRRAKIFSPATDLIPVGTGWPKCSQLEMVTTFTYKSSLVEDRCTQFRVIVVTDPQTHTQTNSQTGPITIHCAAS